MRLSLDLGLGSVVTLNTGASWVPRDSSGTQAPFVLDAQNNRAMLSDLPYSVADFLAATGVDGSLSGGIYTFDSYDIPDAPDQITNGDMSDGTTGYTAFGTSAAISEVSGELKVDTTTSLSGFRQNLPLERKAFRFRATGRRTGTGVWNLRGGGTNAALNAGYSSSATLSGSNAELSLVVPAGTSQRYIGARQANVTADSAYFDDLHLTEVRPFALYNQAEGSFGVEGIADSSGTDQVLLGISNAQSGQSGDTDYIRVSRVAATGVVSCVVRAGDTEVFNQALGTIAAGDPLNVALAFEDATLHVSMNGEPVFTKISATIMQAHSVVRFAGSLAGNAWAGFRKGYYIPTLQPDWWLEYASSGFATNGIWMDGDSYPAGANGVALSDTLRDDADRVVISQAVGGSTLAQARDRILATPSLVGRTMVIWDGSANSYTSVAATSAIIDAIVAYHARPSSLIFIPSVNVGPSPDGIKTSYTSDLEALRDYLVSKGVRTFDPVPLINALAAGSAQDLLDISAGVVCASLLTDAVHLTQPAMDEVSAQVQSILDTYGL